MCLPGLAPASSRASTTDTWPPAHAAKSAVSPPFCSKHTTELVVIIALQQMLSIIVRVPAHTWVALSNVGTPSGPAAANTERTASKSPALPTASPGWHNRTVAHSRTQPHATSTKLAGCECGTNRDAIHWAGDMESLAYLAADSSCPNRVRSAGCRGVSVVGGRGARGAKVGATTTAAEPNALGPNAPA